MAKISFPELLEIDRPIFLGIDTHALSEAESLRGEEPVTRVLGESRAWIGRLLARGSSA